MRQVIMTAPGEIELREAPVPVPGPGEVLLKIQRIGVCGSDVHVFHGRHPYTGYPVIQGHEFSATVAAVGEGVTGIEIDSPVTAMPQLVCGECGPCTRGDYHICNELKVQGFQAPGCAQDLFTTPAENIVPLPKSFTFEQGAMIEPTAVAVHAVSRVGGVAGKNIVVLGAGPIGNLVAQVAQSAGAHVLISDLSNFRLDIAQRCGLDHITNAGVENLSAASGRVFGAAGFEVALECVGVEATLSAATEDIAKGGTIVVVGVFAERPKVNIGFVQDRELSLVGSLMYQRDDYLKAIELIESGQVVTEPLETQHFPLNEYLSAYQYIDRQGEKSMKVFIDL